MWVTYFLPTEKTRGKMVCWFFPFFYFVSSHYMISISNLWFFWKCYTFKILVCSRYGLQKKTFPILSDLKGPDDWPFGLILCFLDASRGIMADWPSLHCLQGSYSDRRIPYAIRPAFQSLLNALKSQISFCS